MLQMQKGKAMNKCQSIYNSIMLFCLAFIAASLFLGCEVTIGEPEQQPAPTVVRPVIRPHVCPKCLPARPCPDCVRQMRYDLTRSAVPYSDLPMEFRVNNYAGGSCVFASVATGLHWTGQHEMAEWLLDTYSGGEYASRLHDRLDKAGFKFSYTQSRGADGWAFLRKCVALRLCPAINIPDGHMQTLVGMDAQNVYVLNNNSTHKVDTYTHSEFARSWTGWAVVVIGTPPPPEPYL